MPRVHPGHLFARTFPEVEKTSKMFPVLLQRGKCHLTDRTSKFRINHREPCIGVEISSVNNLHFRDLPLNWKEFGDTIHTPSVFLTLIVFIKPVFFRQVNITRVTAVTSVSTKHVILLLSNTSFQQLSDSFGRYLTKVAENQLSIFFLSQRRQFGLFLMNIC